MTLSPWRNQQNIRPKQCLWKHACGKEITARELCKGAMHQLPTKPWVGGCRGYSHSDRCRVLQTWQKTTRRRANIGNFSLCCRRCKHNGDCARSKECCYWNIQPRERSPSDWLCYSCGVPAPTSAAPRHRKSVTSRVGCGPPCALLISRCCINCMGLLGTSIIYVNYTDGLLYLATMYACFFSVTCNMVDFFSLY